MHVYVLTVQVHPVPVMDASVKPLGKVGRLSVTVTCPLVANAPDWLDTVSVYAAPLCPCVKLPLCAEVTLSREPAGTLQFPIVCHTLSELYPAASLLNSEGRLQLSVPRCASGLDEGAVGVTKTCRHWR